MICQSSDVLEHDMSGERKRLHLAGDACLAGIPAEVDSVSEVSSCYANRLLQQFRFMRYGIGVV
jgi:hypothetical protein